MSKLGYLWRLHHGYLCDNKFHTEALKDLLSDDKKFGFIVMDGHGW